MVNKYARFKGSNIQHLLKTPTITVCGKDARLANRYPALTQRNSSDRKVYKRCSKCYAV